MPDQFAWNQTAPRPSLAPGYTESEGYRWPQGTEFRRDDLVQVAYMNGFLLTPPLLKKWRQWRFLHGPTAGGRTGKGRGKGQVWSSGDAHRVAWLGRWKADGLSYDVLRLALWPWTRALEQDRSRELLSSIARFVEWDERFTGRVLDVSEGVLHDAYESVVYVGTSTRAERKQLLEDARSEPGTDAFNEDLEFLRGLNFDGLRETSAALDPADLQNFIEEFRAANADPEREAVAAIAFRESPLGLARVLVRELHRFRIAEEASI